MRVRQATEADLFDILVLGKSFIKEAPSTHTFNKQKIEQDLQQAIQSPNMVCFVVENEGEEICGFLIGAVCQPFFLNSFVATELGFFVEKSERDLKKSKALISSFEEWAKSKGAEHAVLADIDSLRDLSKFYSRLGYNVYEKSYGKEL